MSRGDMEAGNAVVKITSDDEGFRAGLARSRQMLREFAQDMSMARAFSTLGSVANRAMENIVTMFQRQGKILYALKPAAEVAIQYFSAMANKTIDFVNAAADVVVAAATSISAAIDLGRAFGWIGENATAAGAAVTVAGGQMSAASGQVQSQLGLLVSVMRDQLRPLVDAVFSQLSLLASTAGKQIGLLASVILMPIQSTLKLIAVLTTLLSLPGKIRDAFASAFTAIPRAIGAAFRQVASLTSAAMQTIGSAAATASRAALSAISSAARAAGAAVMSVVRQAAALAGTAAIALARAAINPGKYIIQPLTNAAASVANAFSSALGSIGDGFQAIAGRLARVGGAISGVAASIIVPLTAAANKFSEAGVNADRLADRLGMSVEAAQELAYAAKQVDVSPDGLASASNRAEQTVVNEAASGKPGVIADLGLNAAALAAMDAEKRFLTLGQAVAGIADPITQAKVAQELFGESGRNLMPLFANGGRSLAEWRAEAQRLGIVMSGPASAAAVEMSMAYEQLQDAMAGLWRNIGEAVAPAITQATKELSRAITLVTKWVNENKPLIATVFRIATAVATIGSVVLTVAGAIGGIGTVFSVMAGAAASVGTAITVVGGALAAILSPIAAVLAAAAGIAIYFGQTATVSNAVSTALTTGSQAWGTFSASAMRAVGPVIQAMQSIYDFSIGVFQGIKDAIMAGDLEMAVRIAWVGAQTAWTDGLNSLAMMTSGSMSGILNALAAGEFGAAFDIAWLQIREAFTQGLSYIETLWQSLKSTFDGVAVYLQKTWNVVLQTLAKQTLQMIREFQKLLIPLSSYDPTGMLDKLNASINKSIGGSGLQNIARQNVGDANAKLDSDLAKRNADWETEAARQRAERDKQIAGFAGQRQAIEADMASKAAHRRQELDKQLADNLTAAKEARAKIKEPQAPGKPNRVVAPEGEENGDGAGPGGKSGGATSPESQRTFVTFSAAGLIAGARAGGAGQAAAQQGPAAIGQAVGQAVANANQNTQQQTLDLLGGILNKATELALLTERQIEAIRAGGVFV